jgi:hypothetical protein
MRDRLDMAIVLSIGFAIGWLWSALKIMDHCDKLNGFYVFSTVYECKVKEETK